MLRIYEDITGEKLDMDVELSTDADASHTPKASNLNTDELFLTLKEHKSDDLTDMLKTLASDVSDMTKKLVST